MEKNVRVFGNVYVGFVPKVHGLRRNKDFAPRPCFSKAQKGY
jgi:hypothetical protein